MPATVLDSFALIAYFRGEPAGVPVKEILQKASQADKPVHMTEVNYAEGRRPQSGRAESPKDDSPGQSESASAALG